jgi:hypothetical protein
MFKDVFVCGPLDIVLKTESPYLRDRVGRSLAQYDALWDRPRLQIKLNVAETLEPARMVDGNYLNCARMNVDLTPGGFHATCLSGFSGSYSAERDQWDISISRSRQTLEEYVRCDIDGLTELILTIGWRRAGWIPIHSGAAAHSKSCAIVCAASGGGKTTLITALVRRGWLTLGDDRLLLRIGEGDQPELAALLHSFNLDPKARKWFPEAKNLESMPTHTAFSDKRRIRLNDFWPKRAILRGTPTHLFQLVLRNDLQDIRIEPLASSEILPTLLTQTVIPNHPQTASQILSTLAVAARRLKGFRVEVGIDAYHNSLALSKLEAAVS